MGQIVGGTFGDELFNLRIRDECVSMDGLCGQAISRAEQARIKCISRHLKISLGYLTPCEQAATETCGGLGCGGDIRRGLSDSAREQARSTLQPWLRQ